MEYSVVQYVFPQHPLLAFVGGTVIIVLVLLVSLIIITQRSFFGFMNKILDFFTDAAREGREVYLEGQPDREKQKELRRKIRAEKRAEKIRRLEEELEEEELALTEKDPENISKKQKKKTRRSQKERQAAVKANREGEFNLPSFLDEQKAVLPAGTDLTEEDPGLDEKPEEHAQPLEFQIHRSQSQPAREESEEPDFRKRNAGSRRGGCLFRLRGCRYSRDAADPAGKDSCSSKSFPGNRKGSCSR